MRIKSTLARIDVTDESVSSRELIVSICGQAVLRSRNIQYYLVETAVPTGAASSNLCKVFTLEIKDGTEKLLEATGDINDPTDLVDSLRIWVSSQPAAAAPLPPPDGGGDTTG